MRFGIFYEHQLPRPWGPDDERRLLTAALEQVELADRLGIDYLWEVEHHYRRASSLPLHPHRDSISGACGRSARRGCR